MSAFKALNIESDDDSDDEIDDTKEVQIEEALKLYQTALKLHADGPQSFSEAAKAYKDLFDSDIFKYPESQCEYNRPDNYDPSTEFEIYLQEDFASGPVQTSGATDSAPNTLPQIVHLAQKNYGLFILDVLDHKLKEQPENQPDDSVPSTHTAREASKALQHFVEALDKDDADMDLWRQTASVASLNGNTRLARFCLEAILDGDDEGLDAFQSFPSIEQNIAIQQLKALVTQLMDTLSLVQTPLTNIPTKVLPPALLKRLGFDTSRPLITSNTHQETKQAPPIVVPILARNWASAGQAILARVLAEDNGYGGYIPGQGVRIQLPSDETQSPSQNTVQDTTNGVEKNAKPEPAAQQQESTAESVDKTDEGQTDSANQPLSRKRSTDSAGLPEVAEGGRGRSKRIRARETIVDNTVSDSSKIDPAKQFEAQLEQFAEADSHLSETLDLLYTKLGLPGWSGLDAARRGLQEVNDNTFVPQSSPITAVIQDLSSLLSRGVPEFQRISSSAETLDNLGAVSNAAGLNAFLVSKPMKDPSLRMSYLDGDSCLSSWADDINDGWLSARESAFSWLKALLLPNYFSNVDPSQSPLSSYRQHQWPDDLKKWVVQVAVHLDSYIYEQFQEYSHTPPTSLECEMIQTLFELHLDVYSLIKLPGSQVNSDTESLQKRRLERWCLLSRDALSLLDPEDSSAHELSLRHLWSSVFHLRNCDDVSQEHTISYMLDIKVILTDEPPIYLYNNAIMPEISVSAIDQELTRMSVRRFFDQIFSHDDTDPVAIIENLEPILDLSVAPDSSEITEEMARSTHHEAVKFLENADLNDRISLWQRLRKAYDEIEYPPRVLSCHLRCLEALVHEFSHPRYLEASKGDRETMFLTRMHLANELLTSALSIINVEHAFEYIDNSHLMSSLAALRTLTSILHGVNLFDDSVRIGQFRHPTVDGRTSTAYPTCVTKMRETQIRAWILLYALLKEGMSQNPESFGGEFEMDELKIGILRAVHNAVGIRSFCSSQGKLFLRVLRDEYLRLYAIDDSEGHSNVDFEIDLSQVFYDLYGLQFNPALQEPVDHGCSHDPLDKRTALLILDFVMAQAKKVNMKDLPKSELRTTIDKVQGALGKSKSNDTITMNKRIVTGYLKSPINPISLYRCLDGLGSLPTKRTSPSDSTVASKGWYFLMGDIAFHRFLSQKKVTQGPTEDLSIAIAFFNQDLEYNSENWMTWFRLAQAYSCQVEELVSWTAEKMNNSSHDLIQNQRYAIHSYTMAVACALRLADLSMETARTISEIYSEFGTRLYSFMQPPFCGHVFNVKESEEKFYSGESLYRAPAFHSLTAYSAWRLASILLKRALVGKSSDWVCHYMLGKCLWKMHSADHPVSVGLRPSASTVIDAFVQSIDSLPNRRDSRRDPVLEPLYKLVSVVHKLVHRKELPPAEGAEILQSVHYAQKISWTSSDDPDAWESYVLQVLKALRNADKSGWHHRMTSRAAHIIYDDSPHDQITASAAKHELTQHIFTKTMAIQVWRPENERPGRHFVYTSRYTQFFVRLLSQLGDRTSLDLLSKRVRKKPLDFFEHTKVWQTLCVEYVGLLRRHGKIVTDSEDVVFKPLNHEDFTARAGRLEEWCSSDPAEKNPVFEALRDAVELKKTNNSLMKGTLIDDLICDAYAALYAQVTPTLNPPQAEPVKVEQSSTPQPTLAPAKPNMMSVTSLMNVMDGSNDSGTSTPSNFVFQVQPTASTEPTNKSRSKGVGRREILRRAEACANKPPPPPNAPVTTANPIPLRPSSKPVEGETSEAEGKAEEVTVDATEDAAAPSAPTPVDSPAPTQAPTPAPDSKRAETSTPKEIPDPSLASGSGQEENRAQENVMASDNESDGDESELSELEDEIVLRPMFPGLMAREAQELSSVASTAESHDGDNAMDVDEGADEVQLKMEEEKAQAKMEE